MVSVSDSNPLSRIRDNHFVQNFVGGLRKMLRDRMTAFYFSILVAILIMAVIGPSIAPYQYDQTLTNEDGSIKSLEPPSAEHPLGTTWRGYDVLSRVLVGARPTVLVGLIGGSMIVGIGLAIGVTAGYVGGRTENILMRFTDFVYGVPLIPFAIVVITLLGVGFLSSIFVLGIVLWRSSARVLRSQVLQIKEYPFVRAAKVTGASTPRIMYVHILPNIASMAVFYFAWGIGYSILVQASLAFLGVSNPFVPGWGIMIRNAFNSGYIAQAWWWSMVPGLLISITVVSTFMFGRQFEAVSGTSQESQTIAG